MHIWYISLYEPLPIGDPNIRRMRSGWICDALLESGNNVELWIPEFDHLTHRHFFGFSKREKLKKNFYVQYLKGIGYPKDTSFKRLLHHKFLAKEFKKISASREKLPDIIITQIPCLELAEAAINFAKKNNIPSVVDVRDLWPDIYKRILPKNLKWIYKILFIKEIKRLKFILNECTDIISISDSYLKWAKINSGRKINNDNIFYIGYFVELEKKLKTNNWNNFLQKKGVPLDKKYIIFSGTFCESYDLNPLIEASKYLRNNSSYDYHFLIAGKGNLSNKLLEKLFNNKDITLLGWLNKGDLSFCLSNAFAGLAPYSKGALMSLPNKFFEYLAYGLPIISSLEGEMNEIINSKKLGINFEAGSGKSLGKQIVNLEKLLNKDLDYKKRIKAEFKINFDGKKIYKDLAQYIDNLFHISNS